MGVFKLLKPDEFLESVDKIDIGKFILNGKDVFIFDFDNTLGLWRSSKIEERFRYVIDEIKSKRGKILIASNGRPRKISLDGAHIIWRSRKPLTFKIKKFLLDNQIPVNRVVMIGDQIFTDILAGNLLGVYTVKVEPLSRHEFFFTRILRFFERIVLKIIRK
ncbi:HAD hydrolase-like protein [Pseudothermotoga sp.]|jgi:hypothetical protein|uniref:YqeG family HAD IIIA-type phosphatase n=1 Tax=Pseudothermotoga sp. TaxID=2033661 RepID=UPI00258A1CEF|nr:HAD hydrolase-like protein [Pseudothermotoga sp.]MDK2884757.1 putative phosphatase [Pseudothermotoga sp.]